MLWNRLGNTALLAGLAFAVIVPLSLLLGILAGMRAGSGTDRMVSAISIVMTSIPEFALGVMLVAVFVVSLHWLPGTSTLDPSSAWSIAAQLVLPVATLAIYDSGYVARMVRSSMAEVMTRPYIRTAVLKGMAFRNVVLKHALRNAMIAPFTVILLQINYLVTGLVVVESLFAYPGFGQMVLAAGLNQDVALVEAGALVAVCVNVATQIAGDLVYMTLNPQIRLR